MKRIMCWVIVAGLVASSYATDARVLTMGRHDNFFMDDISIFRNPANINYYPNMLLGSLGVYKPDHIDTTPAGIVSDAFLLMKHASEILVICRNNYTRKDIFSEVINNLQTNNFANYDVVFNDLDLKRSQYGAYNSYYHKEK